MRRARAVVVLRLGLAAAIAAITVPFIAHAAVGEEALAVPTAQIFPTSQGIGVTWDDVDASAYSVQRKQGTADWQDASGDLAASAISWVDDSLAAGASADYRVLAWSSDTASVASTPVTATRAAQAPVAGDVDVLMVDADPGDDGATWLRNEIAGQVAVSAPADGSRTFSAGTIKLKLPAFFPGPGKYTLTQPQVELTQGDRSCTTGGELDVSELTYTPDLAVETMAASFQGWNCAGVESGLGLEIRIKSTKTYQALSVDPFELNAGTIVSGKTSAPLPVTVKNIGTEPVELKEFRISSGAYWAWLLSSNDCPAVLPIAATCTVKVTFAPNFVAFTRAKLVISDSTSRGWHTAFFSGQGASLPPSLGVTVTPTFTGNAISWPAQATSGGTSVKGYFLHRYVDGVETTQWLDGVNRTTGSFMVADVKPAAGIEYAVSVVNQIGEGPIGTRTKAGRATEQIAFTGGDTTTLKLQTADLSGRVVSFPAEAWSGSTTIAVTASPDGRSLAYAVGSGQSELWTRQADPTGLGTPVKLWTSPWPITHLTWSPDGSQLAFQSADYGTTAAPPCVFVIAASGGTATKTACDVSSPSWMPDSQSLAVLDGRGPGDYGSLARIRSAPGGALIKEFGQQALPGSPVRVEPSGRYIALGGSASVRLIDTFSNTEKASESLTRVVSLAWSPDGNQLLALTESGRLTRFTADSLGGLTGLPPVTLWSESSRDVRTDITWQRLGLVIKPSAVVQSSRISIGYDSTALLPGTTFSCSLSGVPLDSCASPVTTTVTASGDYTLRVEAAEPDGRKVAASRSFTVDATGPVARVTAPTYEASTAGTATVKYSATDSSSIASYDVRYRKASYLGGFGAYLQPWTGTAATSVSLAVDAGYEYCVSVRAKDTLGNVGAWSAEKCFARPVDDRAMAAPTAGWTRTSWSEFYLGTATQTTSYGASLTRTVQGKRFYLVATRCSTCGLVAVYAAGKYIGAVNLASATTQRQAVLPLPVQSTVFNGTLTFTVRSATGKFVQIDGLAVRRS
jgi:WD40 repeat protein